MVPSVKRADLEDLPYRFNKLVASLIASLQIFFKPLILNKMAESEGFEPPVPFRVRLISSQVHSTGLCQLSMPFQTELHFNTGYRVNPIQRSPLASRLSTISSKMQNLAKIVILQNENLGKPKAFIAMK
jgi:hypothetical protein